MRVLAIRTTQAIVEKYRVGPTAIRPLQPTAIRPLQPTAIRPRLL